MKEDYYYKLYTVKAQYIQHLCATIYFGLEIVMQTVNSTQPPSITLTIWNSN